MNILSDIARLKNKSVYCFIREKYLKKYLLYRHCYKIEQSSLKYVKLNINQSLKIYFFTIL